MIRESVKAPVGANRPQYVVKRICERQQTIILAIQQRLNVIMHRVGH